MMANDLFALTIRFAGVENQWTLHFRSFDDAAAAEMELHTLKYGPVHSVEMERFRSFGPDAFGKSVNIPDSVPFATMVADVSKALEADIEANILQQKANMRFQQRMQSDPSVQAMRAVQPPGAVRFNG